MSNPAALDALARHRRRCVGTACHSPAGRSGGNDDGATRIAVAAECCGVTQGLQALGDRVFQLPAAVTALIDAASTEMTVNWSRAIVNLGELIVRAGTAFAQLGTALDAVIQGDGSLNAAQKARLRGVVEKLPDRLLHLALISYVEERQPQSRVRWNSLDCSMTP